MENIKEKAISAIRVLGTDMINNANSGHPGIVLGAAPLAYTLFTNHLNIYPRESKWINRDRFVLSAGHGSALLYSLIHFSGYKLGIDDLKRFRSEGKTPGHPEYGHTEGVEATTGPLGQGIANAVGLAIAEAHLASKFNIDQYKIFDHHTYALCGDGDLQEGVALEAMSLAGHLGLGKLIILFDSNDIQLDGPVNLTYSENNKKKFEAMGWQHLMVTNGNDINAINKALLKARKETEKPTIIEVKTVIGFGTSKAGTSKVHGSPLGKEESAVLRKNLNFEYEPFDIPKDVYSHFRKKIFLRGKREYKKWDEMFNLYKENHQSKAAELYSFYNSNYELNADALRELLKPEKSSTRVSGGKILDSFSEQFGNIIGGSADLTSSTMARGYGSSFSAHDRSGRNINYGVREHAMGAIANGITLHGGLKTFTGAFFVFSDYMKPSIRMAAIMDIPTTFVFSHDSIAVGEDGPTHEPIEQLVGLRAIPNLNVFRPADAKETYSAWQIALNSVNTPTVIVLTRQNVINQESTCIEKAKMGAYIVLEPEGKVDGIIIACGSEVELSMEVAKELNEKGNNIRVVSMPSQYLFEKQKESYKNSILLEDVKTIAVEMGSRSSWYKYTNNVYGIDQFGLSDKQDKVIAKLGFTKDKLMEYYLKAK